MTERKKPKSSTRIAIDAILNRLTSRMGKISTVVVGLGSIITVLLSQSTAIIKWCQERGLYVSPPCVSIDSRTFPETVKLSNWDTTPVTLRGRSNCPTDVGLYVTFFRDIRNEQLFVVKPPRGDHKECRELSADLFPNCWHYKKPIVAGKGEWTWHVPLPPLQRLRDPGAADRLFVTWQVRNYDDPTKPALVADTAIITILSDTGSPGN